MPAGMMPLLRTRWRNPLAFRAGCLLFVLCAQMLLGQGSTKESDVESAFLFDFGNFMHKQAASAGTFSICVLGANPFGDTLKEITAHEQIGGLPIRISQGMSPSDLQYCDVDFISDSERSHLDKDLQALAGSSVLTVGTMPGFLQHGGMIQFSVVSKHVRFSVNLDATKRAHIALSSELLKVALSVSGSPQQNVEVKP